MKIDGKILKQLHEQGQTLNSLSVDFSVSRKTIERLIKKEGGIVKKRAEITRDFIPELKDSKKLQELYENQGSIEKLAKHLGTSAETIRVVFKELGLKPLSKEEAMINSRIVIDEALVISAYEQGLSANKVAAKFGVSDTVVRRILTQANVKIRSRQEQIDITPKKDDINAKLARNLRSRLYSALAGKAKNGSAVGDLGCSIDEAREHIESQFCSCPISGKSMTWDNYGEGGWEIDHVVPLSKLNLTDLEEFRKGCHYTNLQPLWRSENRKKSNK